MSADRVAAYLGRAAESSGLRLRQAVVVNSAGGTVDLLFSGEQSSLVTGVAYLTSLLPQPDDTVWVLCNGPDRLVIGRQAVATRPLAVVTAPNPPNGAAVSTGTGTFLTLAYVAEGNVYYKVTMNWAGYFGTVVGDILSMWLDDPVDATLAAQINILPRIEVAGSIVHGGGSYSTVWLPVAGPHTVNWKYNRRSGTGTVGVYGQGSSMALERFDV